jgi:anti-sigma regulatory factor (Ser/Thr protein kinase)
MQFDSEPLLALGAGFAVEFCARRSGLGEQAVAEVKAATEEAIRDTFELLTREHPDLTLEVEGFDDRLEVRLEHHGEALPTAGLDTFLPGGPANAAGHAAGLTLMTRVDRVLYSTENGASRTTLVKYVRRG